MFCDMIWNLTRLNFVEFELFMEYFQFIRVLYNQSPEQNLSLFDVNDIMNQLIDLSNYDSMLIIQEEGQSDSEEKAKIYFRKYDYLNNYF